QPAISLRIMRLEEILGVKLINRSPKGVQLTKQGDYFAEYSNEMLKKQDELQEEILNLNNKVQGTLSLAVSSNYTEYILSSVLSSFLHMYPNVNLKLKTGWSYQIIEMVKNEQAHIGIFRGNYDWNEHLNIIGRTKVVVISKRKIELKELPSYPRINYKTDPQFEHLLKNWWNQTYVTPANFTMDVDSVTTCKSLVMDGLGYGIITEDYLYDYEKSDLFLKSIPDTSGKDIIRNTAMIYSEKSLTSSIVQAFINHLYTSSSLDNFG